MSRKFSVLLVVVLLSVTVGCSVADPVPDTVYFNEIYSTEVHDASTEWGEATILAGDTSVVVNHTLGVAPSFVLLTMANNPGAAVSCSVKNPQPTQFGIEISGILGADLHFYWEARK